MSLYFQPFLVDFNIYLHMGSRTKFEPLDIKSNTLGDDIALALPGIHVLLGCDSTIAISGRWRCSRQSTKMKGSWMLLHFWMKVLTCVMLLMFKSSRACMAWRKKLGSIKHVTDYLQNGRRYRIKFLRWLWETRYLIYYQWKLYLSSDVSFFNDDLLRHQRWT